MTEIRYIRDSLSSGRAYFLSGLLKKHDKIFAVFEDAGEAEAVYNDLRAIGVKTAGLFGDNESQRAAALTSVFRAGKNIIVSDAVSVLKGVPPRGDFAKSFSVSRGQELSP
ncbi:MAG: hypothetical protein J7M11_00505, partial [Elusimicrobia bacterium]|nr:hypothetical protein [Elusimicrobiota bacterium]